MYLIAFFISPPYFLICKKWGAVAILILIGNLAAKMQAYSRVKGNK